MNNLAIQGVLSAVLFILVIISIGIINDASKRHIEYLETHFCMPNNELPKE